MISKRIPMKSAKQSSFSDLVNYITGSQGKSERVGEVRITNCQNEDVRWAIGEVLATQQQNTRAEGDRTYHLLISFPPGEKPSPEVLRDIEETLCASMGYGEHQRISAVHNDTDSLHIHVAINKIHPVRHTMHEPYRDYQTRSAVCAQLEIKHDLQRVNHVGSKTQSENRAADMEQHAGIESLLTWVRRECLPKMQAARSWEELHQSLSANGLEIRERGNGLVIVDQDGIMVKASTVGRDLSKGKLEARLGEFEASSKRSPRPAPAAPSAFTKRPGVGAVGKKPPPRNRNRLRKLSQLDSIQIDNGKRYDKQPIELGFDTSSLYARFKDDQAAIAYARRSALAGVREDKNTQVVNAKRLAKFKRASIKVMGGSALNRKLLYAMTSKTLKEQLKAIHDQHRVSVSAVVTQHKPRAWADWLQSKALEGDANALEALRRRRAAGLSGDTFAAKKKPVAAKSITPKSPDLPASPVTSFSLDEAKKHGAFFEDALSENDAVASAVEPVVRDHITKEGTVIYRAGSSAIRDDGAKLQISRGTTQEGIVTALRMAVARYGEQVTLTGSDQFKELVVQTAAAKNLPIKFDDEALERRRQFLQKTLNKENANVRTERTNRGRPDRSGDGRNGRGTAGNERTNGAATGATRTGRGVSGGAAGATSGTGVHGVGRAGGTAGTGSRSVALRSASGAGKPGIGRVGTNPPPERKNRLRTLSQLGLVQLSSGSEMLLPGHVSGDVEHQGAKPDNEVRRDLRGGGGLTPPAPLSGEQAARKYITEREEKRVKGFDIPKHRLYNQSDDGPATFAGVRQIEGQSMALLKRDEEVLVLPVNEATARRMKRMKLGDQVTATAKGATKSKGRSR